MSTDTATDVPAPHTDPDDHPGEHWSDLKFVYLALGLAAITAIEVALSYMVDDLGPVFLPALLILMLIKFFAVVMYFMHMRYEKPVLVWFFVAAVGTYVIFVILTFADYVYR